jgi:hypothetical protein
MLPPFILDMEPVRLPDVRHAFTSHGGACSLREFACA